MHLIKSRILGKTLTFYTHFDDDTMYVDMGNQEKCNGHPCLDCVGNLIRVERTELKNIAKTWYNRYIRNYRKIQQF